MKKTWSVISFIDIYRELGISPCHVWKWLEQETVIGTGNSDWNRKLTRKARNAVVAEVRISINKREKAIIFFHFSTLKVVIKLIWLYFSTLKVVIKLIWLYFSTLKVVIKLILLYFSTLKVVIKLILLYFSTLKVVIKLILLYFSTLKVVINLIVGWIHGYLDQASADAIQADITRHGPFYSACQAVFYIFCFRQKDIFEMTKGLTPPNFYFYYYTFP